MAPVRAARSRFPYSPKVRSSTSRRDGNHRFAIDTDGTVWGWGTNLNGELGDGTRAPRYEPIALPFLSNVQKISTLNAHTLALKNDGTVVAFGANFFGALGNGTTTDSDTPVSVSGLTNVTSVAAGAGWSMALKRDGTVWTWGAFEGGQLGTGASEPALTPYQVNGLPAIAWIAAGVQTAVAVATTGEVYVWGQNNRYQIPNAAQDQIVPIPTLVSGIDDAVAVTRNEPRRGAAEHGSVVSWGDNVDGAIGHGVPTPDYSDRPAPGPVLAPGNAGLIDIIGGYGHAFALTDTGTVLAWGTGQFGMLGRKQTTRRACPFQFLGSPMSWRSRPVSTSTPMR